MTPLGRKILTEANKKGLRLTELAKAAGITQTTMNRLCYETGRRIQMGTMDKLAAALDVHLWELFNGTD